MSQPLQPNAIGSIVPLLTGTGGGGGGGVLAGDAVGPLLANTVVAIQGTPVSAAAPALGDTLVFDGASWVPSPFGSNDVVSAPGAYTVPGAVAIGDIVFITGASTADVADRTAPGTMPAVGVVVGKPIATTATVLYAGEASVFVGLTPGAEYWVGVGGAIESPSAAVNGEIVQRIGIAKDATTLIFTPDPTTTAL